MRPQGAQLSPGLTTLSLKPPTLGACICQLTLQLLHLDLGLTQLVLIGPAQLLCTGLGSTVRSQDKFVNQRADLQLLIRLGLGIAN